MIIPLDLHLLVQKLGRFTPSLVLGWRVGNYLREMFDGLDEVRLSVCARGDFFEGLRLILTENRFPLDVSEADEDSPWHTRAWHPVTGTLLEFTFSAESVRMDDRGAAALPDAERKDFYGLAAYGASLDRQMKRLIEEPLESLCQISEHQVIRSRSDPDAPPARCRRCGQMIPREDLWIADGVHCCADCAGIAFEWNQLN